MHFSDGQIHACAAAIQERMAPRQIWLFGSAAKDQAGEGSDIDLLIVPPENHGIERPCFEAKLAIAKARTGVPTDVVVITEGEVNNPTSPLIEDALREGRRIA